jgi:hypothetical protein
VTRDAVAADRAGLELGRATRSVPGLILEDGGVDQRFALAQRDVAIAVVEVAGKRDLEGLSDREGAVGADVDLDVGRVEREAVCPGGTGRSQRSQRRSCEG